ncbi:MAG TPA: altronate dehydratase family protein [Steroidobacteraceae bacterium]|nr:altronate dehydratase family protein [Steroidobacteraceae bacterium]
MTDPSFRPAGGACWRVHVDDDVAVALRVLQPGERVRVGSSELTVAETIPSGHKVALHQIECGHDVRKYGWSIGRATQEIAAGAHVHSHNLATKLGGVADYCYEGSAGHPQRSASERTFEGYRRADGRVGTRNEIWILSTVGCVARTATRIATIGTQRFAGRVDGIHAFAHQFGCSQLGDDLDRTRALLAGLARNPNAGGVLIIGLGCESNQLAALLDSIPSLDRNRVRSFTAQSTENETEAGLQALEELVSIVAQDRRVPCPLADLTIGVKCGGSDGLSGITANPLVGRITDRLTQAGGTAILSEIPEIFGAERTLLARAVDEDVFRQGAALVNDFKRYYLDAGQPVHENPSPGNIAGGITTLEEKSLGAVQKGGRAPLTQVLRYGQQVGHGGLALLESPGNDGISSTALVASGATVLLFTTGRGTPLGFPVPTLKISSNSTLGAAKPHWIDYDAGRVLSGVSMEAATEELLALVVDTASGKLARNEHNDEREIAIWKGGVTL